MHQKIDINAIVCLNYYPSKAKKKRLYIGQFELLLYVIYCSSYFSKVIMVDNTVCSNNRIFLSEDLQGRD